MTALRLIGFDSPGIAPFELEIAAGECLTLSGPSGSGKTRLLRAIADLDPHQGEAAIDGTERSTLTAPAWRRQVGLLPAESHWWGARVADHFIGPIEPQALGILGLDPGIGDWRVDRLSSGERQRLALLRMLAIRPAALLLDEPTANLDRHNIERVERLVHDYRSEHGTAVLWVSHDPDQRRRIADRSLQIIDGRLEVERWS